MLEKILYGFIGFLLGIIITTLIFLFIPCQWDYEINIIDFLTLIATIALSVAVVYLTKSLDKKDIVRDMLIKDFNELFDIYSTNSDTIKKLNAGEIDINTAREEVKMTFHKGDLVIDCIRQEITESFPKFKKYNNVNFVELTSKYYKWLTDGDFMKTDFQVTLDFQKSHETILRNTLTTMKIVCHKLIKSA